MANLVYHGKAVDGKKIGFKAKETAYPQAILSGLGLTKVAASGTVPADVTQLPNNQAKGFLQRVRLSLANGKSVTKFAASGADVNSLKGKTTNGAKVTNVRFIG